MAGGATASSAQQRSQRVIAKAATPIEGRTGAGLALGHTGPCPRLGPGQRKYLCAGVAKGVYSAGLLGAKTGIPDERPLCSILNEIGTPHGRLQRLARSLWI